MPLSDAAASPDPLTMLYIPITEPCRQRTYFVRLLVRYFG
jgi:hypothetical protein